LILRNVSLMLRNVSLIEGRLRLSRVARHGLQFEEVLRNKNQGKQPALV
jgi:hypothetical protein